MLGYVLLFGLLIISFFIFFFSINSSFAGVINGYIASYGLWNFVSSFCFFGEYWCNVMLMLTYNVTYYGNVTPVLPLMLYSDVIITSMWSYNVEYWCKLMPIWTCNVVHWCIKSTCYNLTTCPGWCICHDCKHFTPYDCDHLYLYFSMAAVSRYCWLFSAVLYFNVAIFPASHWFFYLCITGQIMSF